MVNIEETIEMKIFIDPVIFRREFRRYQKRYLAFYDQNQLIHAYLFLQIYIESFLHNYMRHVVELEFKPPRHSVVINWRNNERDKLPIKLEKFATLFFTPVPKNLIDQVDIIKSRFKNVSDIRNMFAHGHEVSIAMTTTGKGVISTAGKKLAPWELKQTLIEVNELGLAWNELLSIIQPHFKSLRMIKDFKFKML